MSDPVEGARSMLDPKDVALGMARGTTQPPGGGETIGQWLQGMGISFDDPKEVALQKIKQQASNATTQGKMRSIAGGSPAGQPPGMPPGPPAGGAPPTPQGGGLASLMGR